MSQTPANRPPPTAPTPPHILTTLPLPNTSPARHLTYAIYGPTHCTPTTPTLLYLHGFPSSHPEASLYHRAALARNLRILAPNRPGMAGSTFHPDRAITDYPADILALLDALSIEKVVVLAVSGGAPYALACAASSALSGRIAGVGIVAGLYPASLGLAGMMASARALLWVAPWATGVVRIGLEWGLGGAARDADPRVLEGVLGDGMRGRPGVDVAVWETDERGFRGGLVESVRGAVEGGAEGAAWEARLLGGEWGFGLQEVRGRVVVWHGGADVNSPVGMAERAVGEMVGAEVEVRVEREEAHASLVVHKVEEVLDTLMGFL